MIKAFVSSVLLIVILTIGLFSLLYIGLNLLPTDNSINQTFRKFALKSEIIKTSLRLHQVGDARYEYMQSQSLPLEVHLFYQAGVQLESGSLEKAIREINWITHKPTPIIKEPEILHDLPIQVSNQDINSILDTYESQPSITPSRIPLNIFVLQGYAVHPSYSGLVVDDHSIILFKNMITEISDQVPSPEATEVSTILHEFGHLAGAEHIQQQDCIMVEKIENIDLYHKPTLFRDTYCQEDIDAIKKNL